jgi:hypothetical protein
MKWPPGAMGVIGRGPDSACCWIEFELELVVRVPAELVVSTGERSMLYMEAAKGRIWTESLSLDARLSGV